MLGVAAVGWGELSLRGGLHAIVRGISGHFGDSAGFSLGLVGDDQTHPWKQVPFGKVT